ncbi:hypothetical protein DUNSADRAFT_67 [Dunaliella salina]|uniref:tRNA-binding domain-containing protein n=1 Tax=Dunaliella salina TaxID=3046 RepID=A0ABQ7H8V6_DUNSA|nr:hypothetical protein DUNSADRAFT_67 [Dunaliella salina]|eukprot:KAF5843265.1 hypothetical protein DUNSADRAFT_67 [Dunaliella salina]
MPRIFLSCRAPSSLAACLLSCCAPSSLAACLLSCRAPSSHAARLPLLPHVSCHAACLPLMPHVSCHAARLPLMPRTFLSCRMPPVMLRAFLSCRISPVMPRAFLSCRMPSSLDPFALCGLSVSHNTFLQAIFCLVQCACYKTVGKHPNADALYLEEINVGEDAPRQVISGLVKFVPIEEMQDRKVVVVCNLKPAKMRDVMSYGMVLCASSEAKDRVVPLAPPEGSVPGDRVTVAGFEQPPVDEVNPKKKILERLFPDMKTDAAGVPGYKGIPFTTSKGQLSSPVPGAYVA